MAATGPADGVVIDGDDFDPVALRKKYDEERDKRRAMRPEGLAQYLSLIHI